MTPIILLTLQNWTSPETRTCPSNHVCRNNYCDASCRSKTGCFGSRDVEIRTLVHNSPASSNWSLTRNIYSARLSEWRLPWRSLCFIAVATSSSVRSPALPQKLATVANRQADTARSKVPSFRQTTTGWLYLAHDLKNYLEGNRTRRHGGTRVYVKVARSLLGIHIQMKSTFTYGINGVGGGDNLSM